MIDTKALREKVLDLAIRGKLVPQDPSDEPASVLLERIRAEKEQMVKDGKLKAKDIKNDTIIFKGDDNLHYEQFPDGTVKCIEDEIPFDVPDGWVWCRLQTICPYGDCEKVETKDIKPDEWILDLEDIEKDTGSIISVILKKDRNSVSTKHKFYKGQLLYSKLRPYLNKVVIAINDGYCTSEILPLKLFGSINPSYMQIYLMSEVFLSYVNMISYGVKMPRLGTEDGRKALIALPPLMEQYRIVEAFNNIKPIIKSIEANSIELKDIVGLIKSQILDLAIRGKLVPQNPDDEPASVLLERIRAEKEELIKQGKIKRDKKESVIFKGEDNSYYEKISDSITCIDDELPFEIPSGWCWCRLHNLFNVCSSKRVLQADWRKEGIPFYRAREIVKLSNSGMVSNELFIPAEHYEMLKNNYGVPQAGDIMVTGVGTIGKVYIVSEKDRFYYKDASVLCFENRFDSIVPEFAKIMIDSCLLQTQIHSKTYGNTVDTITITTANSYLCVLPPKKEQQRIVNAVNAITQMFIDIEQSLT